MAEPKQDALTTSEVAKNLGVSPSLVRTWVSYLNLEVNRSAEGHRIFAPEDLLPLESLKAWLAEGHSLKEYRKERQGDGPFDPRIELRSAFRRLNDLKSQQDALLTKQQALQAAINEEQTALQSQLSRIQSLLETPTGPIEAVLKQLLSAVLESRGQLQRIARFEEDGKTFIEYENPVSGKRQLARDMCQTDAERNLLAHVMTLILEG
jgi:DNA-binding transcriptional MerR regulator